MKDPKEVAAAWVKAFNANDEERVRSLVAEHAILTAPGNVELEGRDAFVEYVLTWLDAFPGSKVTVEREIATGEWIVQRYTFEGTHTGTLSGPVGEIPATGRDLVGRIADLTRVEDGLIVESHLYFDQVDVLTQLGLMPELARA